MMGNESIHPEANCKIPRFAGSSFGSLRKFDQNKIVDRLPDMDARLPENLLVFVQLIIIPLLVAIINGFPSWR